MGRTTIDFGIDLGTTNSEIACMDNGELVVIKNTMTGSEVTPSAVKVDARGTIVVGQNAYNELEYDPDNAVGEFKRWMGNADHDGFMFRKSGKRMTAPELSAEVLKVLKSSASSRFGGEEISAAVITVPAMFLIPSCEDTKAAARLAGIELCPLLQEPVAAAMAYGYRAETLNGNLLVFDLGGGTFDTTILAAREGRLVVIGHDGDDKLGGKDYDWALVDIIIRKLASEYRHLRFSRDGSMRSTMAKLKHVAEEAKKELSVLPAVNKELKRLGGAFDEIDAVIELTQNDFETATEELTRRCISICRRALKQARLSTEDLSAVLLVGGQTQSPYIKKMVASELGGAESRLDPLTVVARGAALFASTQRIPGKSSKPATAGSVELKIAYNPVSTELDADVGIAVQPPIPGGTVSIMRSDGGWSSGAVPVPSNGRVDTTVVLRARKANAFDIQLRDRAGALIPTWGATTFTITHGLAVARATTSRAFGVALANNEVQVIIPNGSPLPAKGTQKFVTAHEVVAGNRKSVLKIYVLEGDNPRADRNIQVGEIVISGDEIRRSLPAGEAVEITYRLDESKTLSAEAVFPSLREAKQMVYRPERPQIGTEDIELELKKEKERLAEIERAAPEKVGSQIGRQIVVIEREKQAASDDHDAAQKAAQRLIEFKQAVDALEASSEWELLVADLDGYRDGTQRVEACGQPDQCREYADTLKAADAAVMNRDLDALRRSVQRLRDIYWAIVLSQDVFWKAQFAQMCEEEEFVDPLKAERLKEEGLRALKREDISSLRTIVWDLYRLLPTWQQGKLDMRFGDAGLRKARGQDA
ncbi:MAG: Hsp70 family protein [Terriglobales bacterium]